tara:strand:- start:165 stop:815 length:651 start_codon:yes stop_codon:yes gene_type:complete
MADKTITTINHDYGPVNKYIDEKARLRRTRSVWGYTRALALFLIALGIFLILAAYAYHIFKKPHKQFFVENKITKSEEKVKNNLNEEISKKDNEIKNLENELNNSPENEKIKNQLDELKKELKNLEEMKKNVVYNKSAVIFEKQTVGSYTITTGFQWNTVDDLRYGKKHIKDWCYVRKVGTTLDYYFDSTLSQDVNLRELNLTKSEVNKFEKYCAN